MTKIFFMPFTFTALINCTALTTLWNIVILFLPFFLLFSFCLPAVEETGGDSWKYSLRVIWKCKKHFFFFFHVFHCWLQLVQNQIPVLEILEFNGNISLHFSLMIVTYGPYCILITWKTRKGLRLICPILVIMLRYYS